MASFLKQICSLLYEYVISAFHCVYNKSFQNIFINHAEHIFLGSTRDTVDTEIVYKHSIKQLYKTMFKTCL